MTRVTLVLAMFAAGALASGGAIAAAQEAPATGVLSDEQEPGQEPTPPGTPPPATQPPPPQPPPPPPPREDRPRRRGSMVGYVDDAIIESQVRVRVETGFGTRAPDRAEFFYAKCGCYQDLNLFPNTVQFHDPEAPGPGPDVVIDMDFQQVLVQGEYAPTNRVSMFAEIPLRWIRPIEFDRRPDMSQPVGFGDEGGIGDLRTGVKLALAAASDYIVTARVQAYFPTGTASRGLGTDHASIEPALLYFHRATERLALESQLGLWLPIGGSDGPLESDDRYAGNVLFYGIGPSYVVYRNDDVWIAPVVELVGWRVLDGFEAPPRTEADTNIVNLKVGARFVIRGRNSIYAGYGHALTDRSWYDDIVRVEYRVTF